MFLCLEIGKFTCNFEPFNFCQWTQDKSDDFDWTRHQALTLRKGFGPLTDHTKGLGSVIFCWLTYHQHHLHHHHYHYRQRYHYHLFTSIITTHNYQHHHHKHHHHRYHHHHYHHKVLYLLTFYLKILVLKHVLLEIYYIN